MHSNNYLDKENRDTKPFLEEIINDLNKHKNIENDRVPTKINNSNIQSKKNYAENYVFERGKIKHFR